MTEYFTLADFRARPDMSDTDLYPDSAVESAAAYIVGVIERETATSFIPRTVTDVYDGDGGYELAPKAGFIRSVTSATVDGVEVTETLTIRDGVVLRMSAGTPVPWTVGTANITLTYTAGYSDVPPGDVEEAAIKGTRAHLLANASNSVMDERRRSLNTDMGVLQFTVAGQDNPTGYPEVDAMILGWRDRLDVLGFA